MSPKFTLAFLALIALASGAKSKVSNCPGNWIDLGDYGCFYFAYEAPDMNWKDGQRYCQYMDSRADLAAIPDPTTQAFLTALADQYGYQSWFIGGSDEYQYAVSYITLLNRKNH